MSFFPFIQAFPLLLATALALLLTLVSLSWTIISIRVIRSQWRIPPLKITVSRDKGPLISVIITARNEVHSITQTLQTVLSQEYSPLETIVVDDGSDDGTAMKVQQIKKTLTDGDTHLKLLKIKSRPRNWVGRTYACHRGAQLAKGEWLLFTDADIELAPTTVSSTLAYATESSIDFISAKPRCNCDGTISKITVPLLDQVISLFFPIESVNSQNDLRAYLYGSFIFVNRETYLKLGGHSSVRGEVVEDRALGELVKRAGLSLRIVNGFDIIQTTWPNKFWSIWAGLQRILSSSIRRDIMGGILFGIAGVFLWLLPWVSLPLYLAQASILGEGIFVAGLAGALYSLCLMTILTGLVSRRIGINPLNSVLVPVGATIFLSAVFYTAYKVIRGGTIIWKDRSYRVRSITK